MESCTVGVLADLQEEGIVREFFELFKIPWEFVQSGRHYPVVICDGNSNIDGVWTKLLIVYAGQETTFDAERNIEIQNRQKACVFTFAGKRLPIYGASVTFQPDGAEVLCVENSGNCAAYIKNSGGKSFARIGYDLFVEAKGLLTVGQPVELGSVATLDNHIDFLRGLIVRCGLSLVEIPPVPDGYSYIACLTHDVDHASIRRHKLDHTIWGFLYRATVGSALNAGRGRLPLRKALTNWLAAAKLPLVQLGIAKDFWYEFDRYTEIERGKPSTFFVIPFEGNPGSTLEGKAPGSRASAYGISHVAEKVLKLKSAGCEIGLHGIDAWMNSSRGKDEASEVTRITGATTIGVRMHWLYGSKESAAILESGGFSYDSTCGYNETIGYRAGTSQAFKPPGARLLLELPLIIMDTALFTTGRLNLSSKEAWGMVNSILDNAARNGGTLTINWHDRSIAPERLWGDFYTSLLDQMELQRPWFSTAMQAVSWFRKRREASFEHVFLQDGTNHLIVHSGGDSSLPGLRLRYHQAQHPGQPAEANRHNLPNYVDGSLQDGMEVQMVSQ